VFGGTRIAYNAATGQPLDQNLQSDVARGALIGGGTGIVAGVGGITAGAAEVAATAGSALPKVPFEGFQAWGREVVQWGRGAPGAVQRIGEMTAEHAARLDPGKVQQARDFYARMAEAGKGGAAALERVKLMDRILELQK